MIEKPYSEVLGNFKTQIGFRTYFGLDIFGSLDIFWVDILTEKPILFVKNSLNLAF